MNRKKAMTHHPPKWISPLQVNCHFSTTTGASGKDYREQQYEKPIIMTKKT